MSVAVLHSPGDDPDKQEIARLRAALNGALVDIANLEVDLRVMRRKNADLKAQLHKKHTSSEHAIAAQEVFDYWAAHCRRASTRVVFGDKRKKAVIGRLEDGYTRDDLMEAIDGAAVDAYRSEKGITYDDLELICRDETKVDSFIKRARAHKRDLARMTQKQVIERLTAKAGDPIFDHALDEFGFRCPACRTDWTDPLHRPLRVRFEKGKVALYCRDCDADLPAIRDAL